MRHRVVDIAVRMRAFMLSQCESRERLRRQGWSTADMKAWMWSGDVPAHISPADNPFVDTHRYQADAGYRAPFRRQVVLAERSVRCEPGKLIAPQRPRANQRPRERRERRTARTVGSRGDPHSGDDDPAPDLDLAFRPFQGPTAVAAAFERALAGVR